MSRDLDLTRDDLTVEQALDAWMTAIQDLKGWTIGKAEAEAVWQRAQAAQRAYHAAHSRLMGTHPPPRPPRDASGL